MVLLHGRNAWLDLLGEGVTILIDKNIRLWIILGAIFVPKNTR